MKLPWLIAFALCAGCRPGGQTFAEDKLGKAGTQAIKDEALAWLAGTSLANKGIDPSEARCPTPRVVLDVYTRGAAPTVEFSRVGKRLRDTALIKGPDDVRCLVLASHNSTSSGKYTKEWMDVRLLDRSAKQDQLVRVAGNDEHLFRFLSGLP